MATLKGPDASHPEKQKVNEIVEKLKKQGIFDKFRKDCLADVDTKPAYLNLRHRVEGAVTRFLSTYKWHAGLNKNLIRENVRKHIIESQMLRTGVDHIIDQVVNPKVQNSIKPAIDRVVCESLGIDIDLWEENQHLKELEEQGELVPITQHGYNTVPSLMDISVVSGVEQASLNNALNNLHYQQAGSLYQGGQYQAYQYPGVQGYQFPTVMGYQGVSVAAAAAGVTTLLNPLDPSVPPPTQPPDPTLPPETPGMDQSAQDLDKKKKKKLEPLTVEDLLNIPLPKEEAKPKKKAMKKEEEVVEGGEQTEERVEFSEGDIMQEEGMVTTEEIQVVDATETVAEETDQPKVYHFAWQDMGAEVSDVSVSSVHTSDISELEDLSADHQGLSDYSDDQEDIQDESVSSPEKPPLPPSPVKPAVKPRKLISLQYNYSDSEDEETREERKARIAKEREERTVRRQQRRAEMMARRALTNRQTDGEKTEVNRGKERGRGSKKKEVLSSEDDKSSKKPGKSAEPVSQLIQLTPKKGKKTKEELKQEIREQKVQEKRMALRRRRTRNPKYYSDDFESAFPGKNAGYGVMEVVVEDSQPEQQETIVIDNYGSVEYTQDVNLSEIKLPPTPTQDEQQYILTTDSSGQQVLVVNDNVVYEMTGGEGLVEEEVVETQEMTGCKLQESVEEGGVEASSRPSTPYSDISDSSLASDPGRQGKDMDSGGEKSPDEKVKGRKTEPQKKKPQSTHREDSQRYETSDLYKPRQSHRRDNRRRGISPPSFQRQEVSGTADQYRDSTPGNYPENKGKGSYYGNQGDSSGLRHEPQDSPTHDSTSSRRKSASPPAKRSRRTSEDGSDSRSRFHRQRSLSHESITPSRSGSSSRSASRHRTRSRSRSYSRSRSRSRSYSRSTRRSGSVSKTRSSYMSRSRSRSRSRSYSSKSRSRSNSYSRSWSRSRSKSRSRSRARSRSNSGLSPVSSEESDISSDTRRLAVPIDRVSFGEAAKQASRRFIEEVDFGEAAMVMGHPGATVGGPWQQYQSSRPDLRGRGGRGFRPFGPPGRGFGPRDRGFPGRGGWGRHPPFPPQQDYGGPPPDGRLVWGGPQNDPGFPPNRPYPPDDQDFPPENYYPGPREYDRDWEYKSVDSPKKRPRSQETGWASSPDDRHSQDSYRTQRSQSPPPSGISRSRRTPPPRTPSPGEIVEGSPSPPLEYRPRGGLSPDVIDRKRRYRRSPSPPIRSGRSRAEPPPLPSQPPPERDRPPLPPMPPNLRPTAPPPPFRRGPPPPPPPHRRPNLPPYPPQHMGGARGRGLPPRGSDSRSNRRHTGEDSGPVSKRMRRM